MPEVNDLYQLINSAQNILVVFKGEFNNSSITKLIPLFDVLNSKGKISTLLTLDGASEELITQAKEKGINLVTSLPPSEYIVTIDYGSSGVEKVTYDTDKDNGKLVFKILPSSAGFSFDKVEFTEGGGKFEATITIGINNPQELRDFYDSNEYLFKENKVFKIDSLTQILSLLSSNSDELTPSLATRILESTLEGVHLIEGAPEDKDMKTLFNLVDGGAVLTEAIKNRYYSKPDEYLELIKTLLSEVRTSNKVIYSLLNKYKVEKFGLEEIQNIGRLPFNYLANYDLAILFIQNTDDHMYILVQSNNFAKYSASTIAGVFGGEGDAGHAFAKLDDMKLEDINKRFSPILKDLYNLDFSADFEEVDVDNSSKVLTKRRRNSKNKGLRKE